MLFIYSLIEIGFLDTRSNFRPANQKAHLTIYYQSKFVTCHSHVYIHALIYTHLLTNGGAMYYPHLCQYQRKQRVLNSCHNTRLLNQVNLEVSPPSTMAVSKENKPRRSGGK